MNPKQAETVKIEITDPCVVAVPGQERIHAAKGEVLELPLEEAAAIVGSGRAVLVKGERLPNALKGEGRGR
jgi:hypothetical protein